MATVALVVVGPKDLPRLMKTVGHLIAKAKSMAADLHASFDEMARQTELDELRKEVAALREAATPELSKALLSREDLDLGVESTTAEIRSRLSEAPETKTEAAAEPVVAEAGSEGEAPTVAEPDPPAEAKAEGETEAPTAERPEGEEVSPAQSAPEKPQKPHYAAADYEPGFWH